MIASGHKEHRQGAVPPGGLDRQRISDLGSIASLQGPHTRTTEPGSVSLHVHQMSLTLVAVPGKLHRSAIYCEVAVTVFQRCERPCSKRLVNAPRTSFLVSKQKIFPMNSGSEAADVAAGQRWAHV